MANPEKFQANAVDDQGNVLPSAQVSVIGVVSGLPVALFSDVDLSAGISNPFNAEIDGSFEFYCENERANLTVTKDGFSRTWTDLFLKKEGAWALEDGSNDSDFTTGYYITPRGWNSRWDYKLTQQSGWTGDQTYTNITLQHVDTIINADTSSAMIWNGTAAFGSNPVGINPALGNVIFTEQVGFNSTIAIKDLSEATAPKNLTNINGDLQWDSDFIAYKNKYYLNPKFVNKTQRLFGTAIAGVAPFNYVKVPLDNWDIDPTGYSSPASNYEIRDTQGVVKISGTFATDATLSAARSSNTFAVFEISGNPLALDDDVVYEVYMLGNGQLEIT